MTIRDVIENMPAHVVYGPPGYLDMHVGKIVAGDLMSDILVSVETDALLVTSLATEQSVRSADIVGSPAVLLVNDKLPLPSMRVLAEECGIALLATPMPMFESCVILSQLQR